MGNTSSSEKKTYKSLESVLDYIASNYILTSDFKSLTKLYEEEYCKNLVVLTQDIISKILQRWKSLILLKGFGKRCG